MNKVISCLLIFSALMANSQWVEINLGEEKNIKFINSYSPTESYIFRQNDVLKSIDNGKSWKQILSDPIFNFTYSYRYDKDSVMFGCIHNFSGGINTWNQKLYRYYLNDSVKMIQSVYYHNIDGNVFKYNNDTFLDYFYTIGGGFFALLVVQHPISYDVHAKPATFTYAVYHLYDVLKKDVQLLGDTVISLSNRVVTDVVGVSVKERYPIIGRNNIRHWTNDTLNQAVLTQLPPSRGIWAFTPGNMILLGENYIARISYFPTIQNIDYFTDYDFKKILFISKDTGFIIGENKIKEKGIILRSVDGGKTWKEQYLKSAPPPLNDIAKISANTLVITCNNGVILRTENGGSNSVGMDETFIEADSKLFIHPNPASDILNFSNPNHQSAELYDMQGVLVKKTLDEQFDIRAIPAGIYHVKCEGKGARFVKL